MPCGHILIQVEHRVGSTGRPLQCSGGLLALSSRVRSNHWVAAVMAGSERVDHQIPGQSSRCARSAWGCAYRPWQKSRSGSSQRVLPFPSYAANRRISVAELGGALSNARDSTLSTLKSSFPGVGLAGHRYAAFKAHFFGDQPIQLDAPCCNLRRTAPGSWPGYRWCPCCPAASARPSAFPLSSMSMRMSLAHRVARLPTVVG